MKLKLVAVAVTSLLAAGVVKMACMLLARMRKCGLLV